MNTIDNNNPNLTAYALGELDAGESAAVEAQLRETPSLRAEVDAIRQTAHLLERQLAAEVSPGLTAQQRQLVQRRPEPVLRGPFIFRTRALWMGTGLAAAACLTIVAFLSWPGGSTSRHNEFALNQPEKSTRGPDSIRPDAETSLGMPAEMLTDKLAQGRSTVAEIGGLDATLSTATANEPSVLVASGERKSGTDVSGGGGGGFGGGHLDLETSGGDDSVRSAQPAMTPPPAPATARQRAGPTGLDGPGGVADRSATRDRDIARREIAAPSREFAPPPAATTAGDARAKELNEQATPDGRNYSFIADNPFISAMAGPSTFSVDVDTASYSNIRQYINAGQLPPKEAVRIEEMINYFPYRYDPPTGGAPFSAAVEINAAPWNPEHRLVRIGLRGKDVRADMRPPTNLVFLIDVSGSMNQPNKLPLVQRSLKQLLNELNNDDRLSIVTYAGNAGIVQEPVYCTYTNKPEIQKKIEALTAGGSTNGAGGIQIAYDLAAQAHIKGGINRVMLCTDGDFNVGASSDADLMKLIQEKRATGVYLSILGFGTDDWQDGKMKTLATHGNGNLAFIDSDEEGKKALVEQMSGTLVTIAKDVKVQVEFDPAKVKEYRLIGYENRVMDAEDFANDLVDAGEIGAGHTVTALYEVVLNTDPPIAELAANDPPAENAAAENETAAKRAPAAPPVVPAQAGTQPDRLLSLRLRYKQPDGEADEESKVLALEITDHGSGLDSASADFKFTAAVAAFGMILRNSPHMGAADVATVLELARAGLHGVEPGDSQIRREFIELVQSAGSALQARRHSEQPSEAPQDR